MPIKPPDALSAWWRKGLVLWGLGTGDIARTGPIFVDIDLTGRCNLRCLCCPYHSPGSETASGRAELSDISYGLVQNLYRELVPMRTASVILQGSGEPLLHPRALDVIELSKQSGFHTTLLTNGTPLNAEMIRSMIDSLLDVIKITLWATSPEEYEQNYPGTSSRNLASVLAAFKLAAQLKREQSSDLPLVYWHCPINHHNWRSVDRVVELAHAVGCDGITFSPLYEIPNLDTSAPLRQEEASRFIPSLVKIGKRMDRLGLRHNISQALLRFRMGEEVWWRFACYIAWYHVRVRVDGRVVPCGRCTTAFGNLNEASFQQIWNGSTIREFRRRARTRAGLASLRSNCDCRYCCFVSENARVHRPDLILAPLHSALIR